MQLRPKNRLLWVFIVLTYGLAWGSWFAVSTAFVQRGGIYLKILGSRHGIPGPDLFALLGNLSPGIGAFITIALASGKKGLVDLWSRSTSSRVGLGVYGLACLLPVLYSYASYLTLRIFGNEHVVLGSPVTELVDLALTLPLAPFFEEIGWRGYLLSKFQETTGSFRASVFVGLIWGPWHAPLLLMAPHPGKAFLDVLIVFCVLTLGLSVLLTCTFNWSSGLLLPVVLFHGIHNAASSYFLGSAVSGSGWMPFLILTTFVWVTAIVVLFVGRQHRISGGSSRHTA